MKDIIYVEHQNYVSVRGKDSFRFVHLIKKEERFIPMDEVEWLVFDHERSYFSKQLVTACMERNIGILFCDCKHSPLSLLTSDYGHSDRVNRLKQQLSLYQKTKNRLWKKIVITKIKNQASCIDYTKNGEFLMNKMNEIAKTVESGDPDNREAYAAQLYFSGLFGKGFRRGRYDDSINAALNYGYAIVRAAIRRELAIHGLEPSLGIKHYSSENPFNLADDLIEPFRPFVDALVYEKIYQNQILELELEEKKVLIAILFETCIIDEKIYTLNDAIRLTVQSFISCLEKNSVAQIKLPCLVEGGL